MEVPAQQHAVSDAQVLPAPPVKKFKQPISMASIKSEQQIFIGASKEAGIFARTTEEVRIRGPLFSSSNNSSLSLADIHPVMGASGSFSTETGVDDFADTPERQRWIASEKARLLLQHQAISLPSKVVPSCTSSHFRGGSPDERELWNLFREDSTGGSGGGGPSHSAVSSTVPRGQVAAPIQSVAGDILFCYYGISF